jgi:hypothetical protein
MFFQLHRKYLQLPNQSLPVNIKLPSYEKTVVDLNPYIFMLFLRKR